VTSQAGEIVSTPMRMPAKVDPQITTRSSKAAQLNATPLNRGAAVRDVPALPPAVSTQHSCDGALLERIHRQAKLQPCDAPPSA
jgi:hypothetical protein